MSREILVPVDGSEPSIEALEFALEQHPDADIRAYYVINVATERTETITGTRPAYEESVQEVREEHARSVLAEAERRAAQYDVDIETDYDRGLPRDAILEYAEDEGVDQIVVGSHGRSGLSRIVIGSVAEKVARHAPVPVTIVRPDGD